MRSLICVCTRVNARHLLRHGMLPLGAGGGRGSAILIPDPPRDLNKKVLVRLHIHQKLDRSRVLVPGGLPEPHGVVLEARLTHRSDSTRARSRRPSGAAAAPSSRAPRGGRRRCRRRRIWTSTWRGRSTYRSRKSSPSLAGRAPARLGRRRRELRLDLVQGSRTMRMPLPPPPIDALIMTGRPNSSAKAAARSPRQRHRRVVRAGHDGHVRRDGHLPRRDLVREAPRFSTVGPDEGDARKAPRRTCAQVPALSGQEAVARVHGLDALALGDVHDGLGI